MKKSFVNRLIVGLILIFMGITASADELSKALESLDDMDPAVRLTALQTLAYLGESALPAVPKILETASGDPDVSVRQVALICLSELAKADSNPETLLTKIQPFLDDSDPAVAAAACFAFENAPDSKITKETEAKRYELYRKILDGDNADAQSAVVRCLSSSTSPRAIPLLKELLYANNSNSTDAASMLMGQTNPEARAVLMEFTREGLGSEVAETQTLALDIAEALSSPLELESELQTLSTENSAEGIRAAVLYYLCSPSEARLEPLVKALESDDSAVRDRAVSSLIQIERQHRAQLKPQLTKLLESSMDTSTKQSLLYAVMETSPVEAGYLTPFLKLAESDDPQLRLTVAGDVTQFGVTASQAIPVLKNLMEDPEPEIAATAIVSTYRLTNRLQDVKPAVDRLVAAPNGLALLMEKSSSVSGSSLYRYAEERLLNAAQNGTPELLDLLLTRSGNPDQEELDLLLRNYPSLDDTRRYMVISRISSLHPAVGGVLDILKMGMKGEGDSKWLATQYYYRFTGDTDTVLGMVREGLTSDNDQAFSSSISIIEESSALASAVKDELARAVLGDREKYLRSYAFLILARDNASFDKTVDLAVQLVQKGDLEVVGELSERIAPAVVEKLSPSDKKKVVERFVKVVEDSRDWYSNSDQISALLGLLKYGEWPDGTQAPLLYLKENHPDEYKRNIAAELLAKGE